jgi:hypothetical protein
MLTYAGEYKHDAMHGKGAYTWTDGARYEGEYEHNRKHGHGVQTWSTGGKPTSICGLQLRVYAALSYWSMRPYATGV